MVKVPVKYLMAAIAVICATPAFAQTTIITSGQAIQIPQNNVAQVAQALSNVICEHLSSSCSQQNQDYSYTSIPITPQQYVSTSNTYSSTFPISGVPLIVDPNQPDNGQPDPTGGSQIMSGGSVTLAPSYYPTVQGSGAFATAFFGNINDLYLFQGSFPGYLTSLFDGAFTIIVRPGGTVAVFASIPTIDSSLFGGVSGSTILSGDPGTAQGSSPGAVPEPATWAIMILGFSAMGVAMRRQRRSVRVSFTG